MKFGAQLANGVGRVCGGRSHALLALLIVSATLAGCGTGNKVPSATIAPPASVVVTPPTATVAVGGVTVGFSATVKNASYQAVIWQVNGVIGGTLATGTISASGMYQSPSSMPSSSTITITAVSAADSSASANASVSLVPTAPPVSVAVTPATAAVVAGTGTQAFQATVSNATDTTVTWQVNGVAGGNSTVGTISSSGLYTAPATVPAQAAVTITAVSSQDSTKTGTATATVVATAPAPPTISGTPPLTAVAGQAYTFTPTASSPRGGTLTFSIANKPAWASFDAMTGTLSGTPAQSNVGTNSNITISVSDGSASASLAPFTITVSGATAPPTISGTPPTSALTGKAYSFTPTASSPRGGTLVFSITNVPAWATFSAATGSLSGTPAATDVGSYANVTISVSDGTASASLAPFTITVTAAPPTISGTPATSVKAGTAYSFTPTASSPRGGTLTFSITNKPAWATFSTTTGQLSGTPATTDIGTFANITITVSDGTASAALAPFTITVQSGTTGSATLTWVDPTTRTDGTALTNLAAIRIYYGTTQGNYPNMVPVTNLTLTTYVIPNLTSGTYFFVATAVDANGLESAQTNSVSLTIP
jgi:hypothetical protein